ncbi:metallopeptidase [Aeoliella sp. ICT_H6.2]|uniref:Metallopeptidase n=1 Tax=Aeoliella straminimaris TaxID=2954799 RepID=A0A9X2FFK4_9BACT|nr:metallopeptidase [Aeoliella straminimaris]MCO6048120.1 metallopeptidase [Aeoliella straminimaris]
MRAHFVLPAITVLFAILASPVSLAAESIAVSNHEPGSTVRYSVVLLQGTAPTGTGELAIQNLDAPAHAEPVHVVQHEDRFRALVQLTEGKNRIRLSAERNAEPSEFEIVYKPQTNPHYVRLVWMTDNSGDTSYAAPDGPTSEDYENRLRTAALLMQTFTAERMNQLGYGHRTFRLEQDDDGQVVVHTWAGPKSTEEYHNMPDDQFWWRNIYGWLNQEHPDDNAKNIVLAAYTRKDEATGRLKSHTALGGGNLGLFGSASVFSWPTSIGNSAQAFLDDSQYDTTRVHDDSVGRSTIWGLSSTTIGATLHEMGHTFGLPHSTDRFDIMTRGFDHFNRCFTFYDPPSGRNAKPRYFEPNEEGYFAPVSASYLRWSPWFQLDKPANTSARPEIKISASEVTISCKAGIPWIGFHVGGDIHHHEEYDESDLPQEVRFSLEEIKEKLGGQRASLIRAIAPNGQETSRRLRDR